MKINPIKFNFSSGHVSLIAILLITFMCGYIGYDEDQMIQNMYKNIDTEISELKSIPFDSIVDNTFQKDKATFKIRVIDVSSDSKFVEIFYKSNIESLTYFCVKKDNDGNMIFYNFENSPKIHHPF